MEEEVEPQKSKAVYAAGHITSEDQDGPRTLPHSLCSILEVNVPELGRLVQHPSLIFSAHSSSVLLTDSGCVHAGSSLQVAASCGLMSLGSQVHAQSIS